MNMTIGLLLVIVSVILLGVAGLLIFMGTQGDPDVQKAYFALLAFGIGFGVLGNKVP